MLRSVLVAVAMIAIVVPVRAADPDISGNWLLTYSQRGGTAQVLAIIKIELKNDKPTASAIYPSGPRALTVTGFEVENGKSVKFNTSIGVSFEGTLTADEKVVGNLGNDQIMFRANLAKTDKTELSPAETVIRTEPPAPVAESQKLMGTVNSLRAQSSREKDADKKKELTEKADAAQKELDEKHREVIAKHSDTPFAFDAAMDLLRTASKSKVTIEEAGKLIALVEKNAAPFGGRFVQETSAQLIEAVATQKGLESVAVALAEKLGKAFTPDTAPTYQSRILVAYKTALESSSVPNKESTLKTVTENLTKIEAKIDADYVKKVPPFKPTAFAGRKDKAANQVVVMELFTGAQCPPCVAADVAFDALQKSYKPSELVLIQYHLHIPGPDPLTNLDTVARAKYYGANSTPTTLFNGKSQAAGGGGMANSESKFKQYTGIIDPLLEKTTDVKVAGKATRNGDKVDIAVEVAGAEGDEMKLRLLVVEETIKYVGGNQLRFHHQVVRAMPGGADGVAIKDKAFKHTAAVDLVNVRKGLTQYLDDFATTRAFPKPERPMDLKSLRVIALVQNDKTKEIVQTLQIEIEGKPATGAGGE